MDNRPQGASGRADETDVDEPDRSASGDDEASSARTPKPKPKAKPRAVKARKPPGKSSTIASKRSPSREPEEVEDPAPKGPAPLTSDDIRVGIRQNTGKANRCRNTNIVSESGYGLVVDHCPSYKTPDGQHRIELDIARDGSVTRAVFLSPAAGGSDIGGCVLETLKTQWSFPESTDGAQKVRMPVRFQKCVPIGGKCVFKG